MATENIKTASEVITEFLDTQAKDESLDADTVAAVSKLRKEDDLSKVKLLRKLEEARKAAIKAVVAGAEEAGDD
ncbi:hypothetical protein [Rhodobacter capsulatus]|uniref:hypothetical protein n=1 Tax=Rhodobacter capsulatus TaxID=1061 RepID=UPI0003D2A31A|nr:hypothetical protein [Rhodobacter capsulatus]ETD89446.1 hypothetical protein U713_09330 [Rhodobacter capsulatus YW2]